MSATRLKVVSPQSGSDLPARSPFAKGAALGLQEPSPFQVLSEAVHSFELLQERCEAAEERNEQQAIAHEQVLGEVQSTVEDKQRRIDYLEAMLEECRAGLQSLAREATEQGQELKAAEARCAGLAEQLAQQTDTCRTLQQQALRLEREARNAETLHKLTLEFTARQSERINSMDLKIAAETSALHQSRDDLNEFVSQTALLQRRPA